MPIGAIIGAVAPSVIGGLLGGASGGGGQTTQTHVNPTIPGYILNPLKGNIQQATQNANNPLYTNPAQNQVAPLTPDQQAAQSLVEQQGGQYQPVQNQAINLTNSLIGQSMAGPSSEQINSLMNPGLQNVLQQQREQSKLSEQQNLNLAGDQSQAEGAYGGARQGVVESQVMNNADVNLANQQAQTLYNTFNSALGQYNTGMGQAYQGSAQLGNQGVQAQNALGTEASQLSTTGGTQQANLQALMNADQQNYLQAQQYPYQQTNYLSNTLIPAGNLATGNTTNSTINQPNSTLGNVVGGAMAGNSFGNSLFGSGSSGGNFLNLANFNAQGAFSSDPAMGAAQGMFMGAYKKGGLVNHLTKHVMNSLKGYASGGNVTDTGFGGDFSGRGTDTTINIAGSQVPWAPLVGGNAAGPPGQPTNPFSFASLSNGASSANYGSGFTPGAWQAGLAAAQHSGSGSTPAPASHTTGTIDSYKDFLAALQDNPSLFGNFSNLNGAGRVNPMLTNPDTWSAMIENQQRLNTLHPTYDPLQPYNGRSPNFGVSGPLANDYRTYMHSAAGTFGFAKGGAIKSNAMPGQIPHSTSMPKVAAPSTNLFGNLAHGGGNTNNYLHNHRIPKYTPAKPAGMSTSLVAHPSLGLGTGLATGGPVVTTADQNRLNHFSNLSLDSRTKATGKKASFAKGGVIGFSSGGFASAYDPNDATDVQDLMAGYPPMPRRMTNSEDDAHQNLLTHMVKNSPAAQDSPPAASSSPADTSPGSDTPETTSHSFLDGVDKPELEMGLAMMGTRGTLGDKLGAAGKVLETQEKKSDKYTPVMGTDGKWYNYDKNHGTMTPMQIGLDPNKGKVSGLDDKKAMLKAQGYTDDDIALILTGQVPKGYVYKNGVAVNPNGAVDAAGEMSYGKSNQGEKGKLDANPGANVELKEGDDGTINAVNKGTLSSAPVTNSTTGNPLKGPLPSTATVADNSAYLADLPAEVKGDDVGPLLLKLHPELAPKVAMAQQLVDGDHKIPTTNRDPYNSVLDLANRMSPKGQVTGTAYTMSQDLAKSTPGSMGGQLTSLNKLGNHALAYSKLIPALAHGDTVAINQARDFFKRQTGQEAPTDIAVANKLFTSEAAKFMAGATGGSDNDRQDYQKALSVYGSPEQMDGGIKVMKDFIAAQGDALHTKVTGAGISEKKWESMLNDNAKTMLSDYKNGAASQSIPKAHALYLKAHPEAAPDFDKKYGPGASAFILQQWKQ